MTFDEFHSERAFRGAWEAITIAREVEYSLFTFGDSELPYYLVIDAQQPKEPVHLVQGEVRISRPLIVRPGDDRPEFEGFFEDSEYAGLVDFLISRSAAFSNLKLDNTHSTAKIVSDSVEEVVSRLNKKLDRDEEDRVAILTAPYGLGGVAVLRYTAQRVWQSAPGNIQELRERGFLP